MPKLLAALLVICLAGHVYLGFALGLSTDEAHYALYALYPALSYFDHPPLVGWVQMPFVWMGGADWMMRVVPFALWGLTAWALWRFSKWALILFLLSPIHHLLGLALIPDSLLFPLTLWVMVLTWKLSNNGIYNMACKPYWIWLGVALGLSGLSKYTGIFLALGAAIVLFASHGLALLKARGLWLAVLIAAVLVSPVFIWNAQNNWTSFAYQINHAAGNQDWRLVNALRFDLVQLLAYGTLPLLGLVVFLWKLQGQHVLLARLSLAFGLPILLFAAYSAGRHSALPHWTAGAWLAFMPAAALGLQNLWSKTLGQCLVFVLGLIQALCVVILSLAMALGGQWQGKSVLQGVMNPFADLHDWDSAATFAAQLQKQYQADAIAVGNWSLASRLAWYTQKVNPNAKVVPLDGKNKQFDIWYGSASSIQTYIWVDWSEMRQDVPLGCQKLSGNDGAYMGQHSHFDFYFCRRAGQL